MANPPIKRQAITPLSVRTRDAADVLGISVRKLFALTAPRGPIRAAKVGTAVLYPVAELKRWLAETSGADLAEPDCRNPTPEDGSVR
jgi:excisionase family DNA binding protein